MVFGLQGAELAHAVVKVMTVSSGTTGNEVGKDTSSYIFHVHGAQTTEPEQVVVMMALSGGVGVVNG